MRVLLGALLLPLAFSASAAPYQAVGGSGHTLILDGDGTLWGWGYNKYGSVGDGSTIAELPHAQTTPRRAAITDVVSIAAGQGFNIAVKSDGSIWTWGSGYLGHGAYEERFTPTRVAGLLNFKQAASGLYHTLALKHDGTVTAWGNNSRGAVGDGTQTHRSSPVSVPLSNVTAIAAAGHSLALKNDGTVWAWGENASGQAGGVVGQHSAIPTRMEGLTDVKAIAAGGYHSLALKNNGTVWAWGEGIALGDGIGARSAVPVQVSISNVVAIDAGDGFSLVLKDDGTVWIFGVYTYSQSGSSQVSLTPRQVNGLSGVKAIGTGFSHSIAILADGTVRTWGKNDVGQLGNGTSGAESNVPVVVPGASGNLVLQSERALKTGVDRLYNWAESAFPQLLFPHAVSGWFEGYYYRCYQSGACLGEAGGRVYLYQGTFTDVGGATDLLNTVAIPSGY
ncbi:MAG: hypothetical protein V4751_09715 [Pseudomonadota bacterium]